MLLVSELIVQGIRVKGLPLASKHREELKIRDEAERCLRWLHSQDHYNLLPFALKRIIVEM